MRRLHRYGSSSIRDDEDSVNNKVYQYASVVWNDAQKKIEMPKGWSYLIAIVFFLLFIQLLSTMSDYFTKELLHDELNAKHEHLKQDYERAMAVMKTLTTRASTDAEYENCISFLSQVQEENKMLHRKLEFHYPIRETDGPWLIIGIPTVSRQDVDYLSGTLSSLATQILQLTGNVLENKIKVVVMNNNPDTHSSFLANREKYSQGILSRYFEFVNNHDRQLDERSWIGTMSPNKVEFLDGRKSTGRPPDKRIRQQTRDVVDLLQYVSERHNPKYYLFMEDDFTLCDNGLSAITYLINRSTMLHGTAWTAIRASFGLNGIIIQGDELPYLASYFERHQRRRPPDHLVVEWFAGETVETNETRGDRVHIAYKYNILEHEGTISSIRTQRHDAFAFPKCWDTLGTALFEIDSFKEAECSSFDIWPCNYTHNRCHEPYCMQALTIPPPLKFF